MSRNGGRKAYRAAAADDAAWQRARRPKPTVLASRPELLEQVRTRLERDWSPEQIAASLRRDFPNDPRMWISHETIYRSIYVTGRQELATRMSRHLRTARTMRYPRLVRSSHGRGCLRNMVSIHARPATVTDRLEPGHWEGDLVVGRRPSAVATLVERSTRYVRVVPLPDGIKADAVSAAIAVDLQQIPPELRRSLTWDRGREMARHQELSARIGIDVTSVIPAHHGNAAPTRTRTVSSGSTWQRTTTSVASTNATSLPSRRRSTLAHGDPRLGKRTRTVRPTRPSVRPQRAGAASGDCPVGGPLTAVSSALDRAGFAIVSTAMQQCLVTDDVADTPGSRDEPPPEGSPSKRSRSIS